MFNLFRRKTATAPKSGPAANSMKHRANPPSTSFDQMEAIARCIQRFMDHGTFVGGLDAAPGYRSQVMPNGMQVSAHRDKRIGVVLDKAMLGISAAGVMPVDLGMTAASCYFKNYHKHEPNWQIRNAKGEPQVIEAEMPFGLRYVLHLVCKEEQVDTQFDGKNEPGCTLMFTVRPKS